jgi:sarcosine oxidase subunit beta
MDTYDVIVIGAGITGASTAYYLKKSGVENVLLLEKGASPACSNTGRSAGIVRTFYTTLLMTRIAKAAVNLFEGAKEEFGNDFGFQQTGFTQLMPADWKEPAEKLVAMHQAEGIDTRIIDPSEYGEQFPWLNPEGVGLVLFEADSGYSDPVQTTEAFVDAFTRLGGKVRFKTPCRGLLRNGDRVTGIILEEGSVSADKVVNSAGPWAKYLAESINLDLPLRALREQDAIIEVPKDCPMPTTPVANAIDPTYMRPMAQGGGRWLLGQGFPKPYFDVDPYNYKESLDDEFSVEALRLMANRVPSLQKARTVSGYAALYDVTPDWMPFFGPRAGLDGYYDASGGSGHAFKTAPILAMELVDWMLENSVKEDFRQLSFDRVNDDNLFVSIFGGNRC